MRSGGLLRSGAQVDLHIAKRGAQRLDPPRIHQAEGGRQGVGGGGIVGHDGNTGITACRQASARIEDMAETAGTVEMEARARRSGPSRHHS